MNIYFEIENSKANILTDNKGRIKKDATNNIEEILITENNIEQIECDIQGHLSNITFYKNKITFLKANTLVSLLCIATGVFSLSIGLAWPALIQFILAGAWIGFSIKDIIENKKLIKASEHIINELENNLQTEKDKLNELRKDKTNDLIDQKRKKINKSEVLCNLKRKLDIIYYYEINKSKLINAYKNGTLLYYGLKNLDTYFTTYDEQIFLEELILNDLNKKEKSISKQKTLTRR